MIDLNSNEWMIIAAIFVSTVATFLTRVSPFYAIRNYKPNPWLDAIQRHMGMMIMVILIFYALKDTKFDVYPYGLREAIGVITAILIHLKFKNALLSIVISTGVYMACLRLI